ncbi:hypothetical protein GLOTRDRAFT_132435 [Gloeophyllum trabeum ATCC 11539]|uniref:Condensin complex subunit 1 C-terminal domain-containing protein n=1 Tax=Gloeophyllum trabeum (strain ATCC 11539 / FP-39264 / Madison 617) TaxID=670483 RepID=S7PXH9_GLOTA|nr:uncharacterized protein GLOTRDRAFT_132435 [Gloeophyllum trabeum ATCC 11539]EPQ52321.1 hypothetical protein GLOTRDRAFT_132435 [Gloeophyllum trabeum ATCC 11539]
MGFISKLDKLLQESHDGLIERSVIITLSTLLDYEDLYEDVEKIQVTGHFIHLFESKDRNTAQSAMDAWGKLIKKYHSQDMTKIEEGIDVLGRLQGDVRQAKPVRLMARKTMIEISQVQDVETSRKN